MIRRRTRKPRMRRDIGRKSTRSNAPERWLGETLTRDLQICQVRSSRPTPPTSEFISAICKRGYGVRSLQRANCQIHVSFLTSQTFSFINCEVVFLKQKISKVCFLTKILSFLNFLFHLFFSPPHIYCISFGLHSELINTFKGKRIL